MTDWISAFVRVRYRLSLRHLEISMTPDLASVPAIRLNHARQPIERRSLLVIRLSSYYSDYYRRNVVTWSFKIQEVVTGNIAGNIGYRISSYSYGRRTILRRAAWSLNNYARSIGWPLTVLRANRAPPSTHRVRIRRANLIKHLC